MVVCENLRRAGDPQEVSRNLIEPYGTKTELMRRDAVLLLVPLIPQKLHRPCVMLHELAQDLLLVALNRRDEVFVDIGENARVDEHGRMGVALPSGSTCRGRHPEVSECGREARGHLG